MAALAFPLERPTLEPIDNSWMTALESAHSRGLVHGRDFFWTWGPLGYLAQPAAGLALPLLAWAALIGVWAGVVRRATPAGLAASALSLAVAFWPRAAAQNPEMQLAAAAVLASMLAVADRRRGWTFLAAAIVALLFSVKFTAAAIAGLALFVACVLTRDVAAASAAGAGALAIFSLAAAPAAISGYLRGVGELASAYADVMMFEGRALLPAAVAVAWVVVALAARRDWRLLAVCAGPLWITMKYGLTRIDAIHLPAAFAFSGVALAYLLAREAGWKRSLALAVCHAAIAGFAIAPYANPGPAGTLPPLGAGGPFLPLTTVYDSEPALVRPLPVPQLYQAGTPWLDEAAAAGLRRSGETSAVADLLSIDGRHPLLDAPRTWLAALSAYRTRRIEGTRVWLDRAPRQIELRPLGRATGRGAEPVAAPLHDGLLAVRIHTRRSLAGHLRRALYRVPEIRLAIEAGGVLERHRVPPQVLSGPLLAGALPVNAAELAALFAGRPSVRPVAWVRLEGPGRAYLADDYDVEFFDVGGFDPQIQPAPSAAAPSLDLDGAMAIDSTQQAALDPWLRITGWAIDPVSKRPARVFAEVDGKLYGARSGYARPDVVAHFREPGYAAAGFVAWAPVVPGSEIRFRLLLADGRYSRSAVRIPLRTR